MKKIIVVDLDKCMSCHNCEIFCAVAHANDKDLYKAVQESPKPENRMILEKLENRTMPLHCRHCEDAPCLSCCPKNAISRLSSSDPVIIDNEKCIGCQKCIRICPFGVIRKSRHNKVVIKCDLCIERLELGKDPACVEACPTKSIQYLISEKANEFKDKKYLVCLKKNNL